MLMTCACRFLQLSLWWGVLTAGESVSVCGVSPEISGNAALSAQFFCEPKLLLKKKAYLKKKTGVVKKYLFFVPSS